MRLLGRSFNAYPKRPSAVYKTTDVRGLR